MGAIDLSRYLWPDGYDSRQPQNAPAINWDNPITAGLVGLIDGGLAGKNGDLVTGSIAPLAAGAILSPAGVSRGQTSAGSSGGVTYGRLDTPSANWRPTSPKMTLVACYTPTANTNGHIAGSGPATASGFNLFSNFADGTVVAQFYDSAGRTAYGATGNLKLNKLNVSAMTCDGANMTLFHQGKSQSSVAVGGSSITYAATFPRTSLLSCTGDFTGLAGSGHWMGLWNRPLTPAEIRSLTDNPWQLFAEPVDIPMLFAAAAGGGVALAGNAAAIASASGSLAVAVPLSGAAVAVATATGQISAAIPLSGAAAAVASATGSMSVGISLSGTALAQAVASGALSSAFPLAGGAVAQASALGSLSIQFALSGAAVAQASATGNLNPGNSNSLAGNAQAQAQATGALSIAIPLAGNAQVVATATGNLGSGTQLAGAAVAVAAASGNLVVTVTLSGAALAQAIAAGGLALAVPLAGNAVANASANGYLNGTEIVSLRRIALPEINLTVACPALSFKVEHPEINRTVEYEL